MCVVCYLSTDRVIDEISFDENKPGFNISLEDRHFDCLTKRFVYYCGSSSLCGCEFGKLGITEDILQQTEQEFQNGALTEDTSLLWWNQNCPPPDEENFFSTAKSIRESHQDTLALYDMIKKTHEEGYESELFVFWDGDEDQFPPEIKQICLDHEPIDVDFDQIHHNMDGTTLLYRFA